MSFNRWQIECLKLIKLRDQTKLTQTTYCYNRLLADEQPDKLKQQTSHHHFHHRRLQHQTLNRPYPRLTTDTWTPRTLQANTQTQTSPATNEYLAVVIFSLNHFLSVCIGISNSSNLTTRHTCLDSDRTTDDRGLESKDATNRHTDTDITTSILTTSISTCITCSTFSSNI